MSETKLTNVTVGKIIESMAGEHKGYRIRMYVVNALGFANHIKVESLKVATKGLRFDVRIVEVPENEIINYVIYPAKSAL